jgi:hypothetical protein
VNPPLTHVRLVPPLRKQYMDASVRDNLMMSYYHLDDKSDIDSAMNMMMALVCGGG